MEEAVREALARFALEKATGALVVLTEDGRVVESNRSANANASELDLVALFDDEDVRLGTFLEDLRASGEARRIVISAAGNAHDLSGTRVGAFFIVTARVGSTERLPEEELAKLRFEASLGVTAATMVHDFNNLLTPILIISSRLARELEEGSLGTMATIIDTSAALAAGLARDLLALAKPRTPMIQRVGVNDTILELRPLLERMLGEEMELVLTLDPEAGDAMLNRKRLEHALLNLVVNARDALNEGGLITITTRVLEDEERSRLLLSVSDTGLGMTSDVRARALDGFFTTKGTAGGLGLGLTSVQRFAGDCRAELSIDSEPMKGTTVTMLLHRLPRAPSPPALVLPERDVERRSEGAIVLVGDRDERVRTSMKLALEGKGYTVVLAANQDSAIERAMAEPVRLAILEDRLMGREPRTFLHRLLALRPNLRLVLMSDTTPYDRASGVVTLLPKAFSEEDLVRAIRHALDDVLGVGPGPPWQGALHESCQSRREI